VIHSLLAEAAEKDDSYRELATRADVLARRLGDVRGARVAVVAPNSVALVAGLFAAWQAGAAVVPLSARLREHELSQILADAQPAAVVSVPAHLGYSFRELLPRLAPTCVFVEPEAVVVHEERGPAVPAEPLGEEIAAILYTSGTTGVPKGALVTHAREAISAPRLAQILGLRPDDVVAFVIPISHAFGLTCYLAAVSAGARAFFTESTFSLGPLLDALEAHGATVLHGSPALFTSLLKARPEGLPGVRGFVAGAPASPELLERLDAAGMGILNVYGLTETGAVCSCRRDDPLERRLTTVGRPLPGYEVRTVDGELQIRGPHVTPGYLHRPEETAAAFADGWFRTGDVAEIAGGYVRIAGRRKELVHVGGFNVFPAEVEAVLLSHPDVAQAAVVGVPHERMGEALRAFLVARPGADLTAASVLAFARPKVAGYKLPYEIRIVSELPLLASGKPDRRALAVSDLAPT
jgi:acyl-CoA synthetase (AMP-forming)/AMP-acid ligase II